MPRYHVLAAAELRRALEGEARPVVLDVRDAAAFEAGHVPGSLHLPVHEIGRRRRELPGVKVRPIVVVGDSGKRSQAAATWLVLAGHGDVGLLEGGFAAWDGPVERGPPPPPRPRGPELRVV